MQISEEEGRLKKDEEETKEMWKRKREHEEQWEGTREKRVSFIYIFLFPKTQLLQSLTDIKKLYISSQLSSLGSQPLLFEKRFNSYILECLFLCLNAFLRSDDLRM